MVTKISDATDIGTLTDTDLFPVAKTGDSSPANVSALEIKEYVGGAPSVQDDTGDTIASAGTVQFVGVKVSGSSPTAITNMTTIVAPPGVGTNVGYGIRFVAGSATNATRGGNVFASSGDGYGTAHGGTAYLTGGRGHTVAGGDVRLSGGVGGPGTSGHGGHFSGAGGLGGSNASGAYGGGSAYLNGGASYSGAPGGYAGVIGGICFGSGAGGAVRIQGGYGNGGGAGGNIYIVPGNGTPPGKFSINFDTSLIVAAYSWAGGAQLNHQTIFTTTRSMEVTAVIGRVDAVNGAAGTLVIVKAASATAPGSGTALTSSSMDLTGTANTNQTLTLSSTLSDLTLSPGDSLCMVTTGTLGTSAGCITVWGCPT